MLRYKGSLCINKLQDRSGTKEAKGEYTFLNPDTK